MACMHTSRSLKGRMLRQKGHLKSATAAVVEISAPLWTNLSQKLRSSAGPRRRCEHRRVHSGQSHRAAVGSSSLCFGARPCYRSTSRSESRFLRGMRLWKHLCFWLLRWWLHVRAQGVVVRSSPRARHGAACRRSGNRLLWPCLDGRPFLREWAEAVGDELSKMDNAAELRCASTYQSLAPQMGALSTK